MADLKVGDKVKMEVEGEIRELGGEGVHAVAVVSLNVQYNGRVNVSPSALTKVEPAPVEGVPA